MTYQEAYQKATGELKAAGIPEPESDAWILLEHVTGMTRTRYYVDMNLQSMNMYLCQDRILRFL